MMSSLNTVAPVTFWRRSMVLHVAFHDQEGEKDKDESQQPGAHTQLVDLAHTNCSGAGKGGRLCHWSCLLIDIV